MWSASWPASRRRASHLVRVRKWVGVKARAKLSDTRARDTRVRDTRVRDTRLRDTRARYTRDRARARTSG